VGVYNLQTQDVDKLMPQLDQIFGAKGESPLAGMFRFVPIEATNSIIVITPQPEYLSRAQEWLMRLDASAGGGEAGSQIYIYDVLNVKAGDLADHLNEIFNGMAPSHTSDTSGSVAPGLTQVEATGSRLGSNSNGMTSFNNNNRQRRQQRTPTTTKRSSTGSMGGTDGGPRITSVDENNQLLVLATPSQWSIIQQAAKRLDIAPLQVQVEAKILEVQLTGKFSFGVQWYLEGLIGSSSAGGPEGRAQPGNQQAWALGGAAATTLGTSDTFFYSFVNSEIQGAIHAMESNGDTKILSAPSIVVLNNQQAAINVGDQIPVVQTFFNPGYGTITSNGTTTSGTNYNTGSVSFRDTGIQLDVTPRVNPGGLVYMDIDQEVSKPGPTPDPTGNYPISQRSIQTQVAVQSGQTVLLGGLIQQTDSNSGSGLPWVSRIPILGKLFGTTSHDRNRTELIVLITPRVIYNSEDANRITREYQLRFESLKPFLPKARKTSDGAQPAPATSSSYYDGDVQP
jgi:general secretion pathway protein D